MLFRSAGQTSERILTAFLELAAEELQVALAHAAREHGQPPSALARKDPNAAIPWPANDHND